MEKTYETSKEESYSQSIQDTISVPLPAHTGIDINVDVKDMKTTIPYAGAVRIKYKTMILSLRCHRTKYAGVNWDEWLEMTNYKYTSVVADYPLSRIWMPESKTAMFPAMTPTA